jgi:hypothetical protein
MLNNLEQPDRTYNWPWYCIKQSRTNLVELTTDIDAVLNNLEPTW